MMRAPIRGNEAALRKTPSHYPEPFASRMAGRHKRPLGDLFGLRNFGVNLTTLEPGAVSALQHRHSRQDEFIYVVDGDLILVSEGHEWKLSAGMCAGFPAGGESHHLENRSSRPATYLEVGDRSEGDEATYPFDDLVAVRQRDAWRFTHKNGDPY